jgi:hypothetical protein
VTLKFVFFGVGVDTTDSYRIYRLYFRGTHDSDFVSSGWFCKSSPWCRLWNCMTFLLSFLSLSLSLSLLTISNIFHVQIAIGGVEAILQNIIKCDLSKPLVRLSYACLCHIADTTPGRLALIECVFHSPFFCFTQFWSFYIVWLGLLLLGRNRVIERALQVPNTTDPKLLYYIYRFLEICCQHHNTTLHFLKCNGVDALVANIIKFHNQVHSTLSN